ncbi:MAG TPA: cytochrome c biogenesis protein CcdA [Gemmataceae bacterium]|nr:cytochrome c biogenesis protein CcdA [Gemmataceae bacterium]
MNRTMPHIASALALVMVLAVAPSWSRAQFDIPGQPGLPRTFENAVTKLEAKFNPVTAKRGEKVTWMLTIEFAPGWHTYPFNRSKADLQEQQYTKLNFSRGDVIFVGPVTDTPTKLHKGLGGDVRVHEDQVVWQRPAIVSPDATPGYKSIKVEVDLLVCDDKGCLPPKKLTVEAPLTISDAAPVAVDPRYADEVKSGLLTQSAGAPDGPLEVQRSQTNVEGIATALGFGFLAGLILNVMPCVLPVVSLKIYGFVQQAGEDRDRVRFLGLAFGFGILVVFVVLAALAAFAGLGWGQQFQKPAFLVAMVALMVAFSLGMFDIYMIRLPGFVSNVEAATAHQEGVFGSFCKGMLATVLATPCSGPLLGATLAYAFSQPPMVIFAIFAMIGVGMAFPYVLLSLNPAWLRFMPKPGEWMNTFKEIMGFLMLGTAAWLLWQRRANGELVFWTVAFCIFVSFGLWLYGRWSNSLDSQLKRFAAPIAALVLIALGGFFCFGIMYDPARAATQTTLTGNWQTFSKEKLAALQKEGKTVIVDWTAEW